MILKAIENSSFFKRRNIVGVEYVTSSSEDYLLSYCHVEKSYKKIRLKAFGEESVQTLKKKSKRKDIHLNISGKQVLYKQISVGENPDENSIISKVIPAGKVQDFYYQLTDVSGKAWCAVIRKDNLQQIIETFDEQKLNVVNVSLGPLNSAGFKEIIGVDDIVTSSSLIQFEDGNVSITKRKEEAGPKQLIDGKTVSNYHVNAFSTALSYHIETGNSYGDLPNVSINLSESRYDQMKLILGGLFLMVMSVILLANLFLRSSYEEALSDLNMVNAQSEDSYQQLTSRQLELSNKKNLLIQNGMDRAGVAAFYSDRIASTIPSGVNLLQLDIKPLDKTLKDGERSSFIKETILVTGVSPNSADLNKWTVLLHGLEFVNEVTINNYSQSDRENPGIFDLIIQLN